MRRRTAWLRGSHPVQADPTIEPGPGRLGFAQVDYQLAVIGFEASGQVRSSNLAVGELPSGWGYAIPVIGQLRYVPART